MPYQLKKKSEGLLMPLSVEEWAQLVIALVVYGIALTWMFLWAIECLEDAYSESERDFADHEADALALANWSRR